jgi:hypothetical protein
MPVSLLQGGEVVVAEGFFSLGGSLPANIK